MDEPTRLPVACPARAPGATIDAAHTATWDGSATRAISAGIYFVRFQGGSHTLVRRLVLL